MKKFYAILLLLVAAILAGTVIFFYIYHRPAKDISRQTPEYTFRAAGFAENILADTATAYREYPGKVIQLEGTVSYLETDRQNNIHLFFESSGVLIQCTIGRGREIDVKNIKKNSQVTIKGICAGVEDLLGLTVKIKDCVVIKNKQ